MQCNRVFPKNNDMLHPKVISYLSPKKTLFKVLSPKTTVVSKETRTLNKVVLSDCDLEQLDGMLGTVGIYPMCVSRGVGQGWVVAGCILA